jgi:methionyl-tRNA formyltransferase
MKIIIITKKIWDKNNFKNFKYKHYVFKKISKKTLKKTKPTIIFFIHWSKLISSGIYKNYNCIQFHCSDLPKFRGGSPVQNQIINGITTTKLSAFKVGKVIDSGPVYLKRKLSLLGNANNIYERMEKLALKMIGEIVKKKISPKKQVGKISYFKRRTSDESILPNNLTEIKKIYNFIRMLDATGYPKAKIIIGKFVCEFYAAEYYKNKLNGKFSIKKK